MMVMRGESLSDALVGRKGAAVLAIQFSRRCRGMVFVQALGGRDPSMQAAPCSTSDDVLLALCPVMLLLLLWKVLWLVTKVDKG